MRWKLQWYLCAYGFIRDAKIPNTELDVRLVDLFTEKFLILTSKQSIIDDTSLVSTVETSEVPVSQPTVSLPASQPQYEMPMHYFSGKTVMPSNALAAQQTYTDPLTSLHGSANFRRTYELENSVPPYSSHTHNMPSVPPRTTMPHIGPIMDEMFDRYVQRWQHGQQPVRPTHQHLNRFDRSYRPVRPVPPVMQHQTSRSCLPPHSQIHQLILRNFLLNVRMIWLRWSKKVLG